MTREEMRYIKQQKEKQFIESIKGQKIDGKTKAEYRKTSVWKEFRNKLFKERKIDALTGRKLTKTWNCHHERFDPTLYTDLDEEFFLTLNTQIHDWLHIAVSETIKNPKFMDMAKEIVEKHIQLNNNKDVKDFLKK